MQIKNCRAFVIILAVLTVGVLAVQSSSQMRAKYSEWSTPVTMGSVVNSPSDDNQPTLSKNGLSLYFASTRGGGSGAADIYVSQREDENAPWGVPTNLGPTVNSGATDAGPALSRDGHWLLFQSNRGGGVGLLDLMASYRQHTDDDFGWQTPINLVAVNSPSNDTGSTYFEGDEGEGPELYFCSDRPGGIGGFDIYVSRVAGDGTFGPPVLVPELNSSLWDQRPAISHNGREIFFHSGTLGSFDIWVSTRPTVSDPWATPINLEAVNTTYSDQTPTISPDDMTLIFASTRAGGPSDLYMCTRTKSRGER